jgi:hypothetical protein
MLMIDQYGDPVPDNLLCISAINPERLTDDEIKTIVNTSWYEDGINRLWIAEDAVPPHISEMYLTTGDLDEDYAYLSPINYVSRVLKRWSVEDGFYHS